MEASILCQSVIMGRNSTGLWNKIGFGYHSKRTLPHVILNDPEWFYSAYEQSHFRGQLLAEAELVYNYAKSVKTKDGILDLENFRDKPQELKQFCEERLGMKFPKFVNAIPAEQFFSDPKNFTYKAKAGSGRVRGKRR